MRAVLTATLLAACVYVPDSFHGPLAPFPGKRVSLGCIDLAVTLTDDARAVHGPVVEYSFGNRCGHAVVVDLASVHVIDSAGTLLSAYDPRHEIKPLRLDALWSGSERIEYRGTTTDTVCVDVGELDRSAPTAPNWVCLGAELIGGAS